MELKVQGRNVSVSPRLQEHIEDKVAKFSSFGEAVSEIEVKFSLQGHSGPQAIRVEITVMGRGPVLRAEASGEDKFAVFDETYVRLLERMRRARDRRKSQRVGGRHPISVSEATGSIPLVTDQVAVAEVFNDDLPVEEAAFAGDYQLDDQLTYPIEIRRKSFPAEPMTAQEAVDRMELVGHDFFLFVDSESGAPSVAYRRKGWSYGVLTLS